MFQFDALYLPAHNPPRDPRSWPAGSELRENFGQKVLWWPRTCGGYHMSDQELEPYRKLGDDPMDEILDSLEKDGRQLGPTEDLLKLAEEAQSIESFKRSQSQEKLVSFVDNYSRIPDWAGRDQLERGQEVFLAYTPAASLALYYRSLVAGFSIPKIAAVIRDTAYLSPPSRPDQALQRLLDTAELTASCTGLGLDSIFPGGLGWKTALYVRVLHAKVRRALLQRTGGRKWDVETYGIPINQEDMAATLLAFSVNTLDGIDVVAGIPVREQERLDYLALWRYIGWLLGVETERDIRSKGHPSCDELPPLDPCGPGRGHAPDPCKNSAALLESFILHLLDPDDSSAEVAHHLLKVTDRKPPSLKLSEIPDEFYKNDFFYFRSLQCRRLIGDPLADALQLPLHPNRWRRIWQRVRSTIQLSIIRYYTLAAMLIPFARRRVIQWHTSTFHMFHENWTKTHRSKMSRALATREKSTCLKDDVRQKESGSTTTNPTKEDETTQRICPFAMVASPQ